MLFSALPKYPPGVHSSDEFKKGAKGQFLLLLLVV